VSSLQVGQNLLSDLFSVHFGAHPGGYAAEKQIPISRLTGNKLEYLLNFGGEVMKSGITRCVNGLP